MTNDIPVSLYSFNDSITDYDYNRLSNAAYNIKDASKNTWTDYSESDGDYLKPGQIVKGTNRRYQVMETDAFDTVLNDSESGLQATVFTPEGASLPDGEQYDGEIVITYAGTNTNDSRDIKADVDEIGLRKWKGEERQTQTALEHFDQIQAEYPNAQISTTGHSLGGFVAQHVAIKNQIPAVVYNAPSNYGHYSEEELEWFKNNPELITNYRNEGDPFSEMQFGSNPNDVEVDMLLDNGPEKFIDAHGINNWKFDESGNLVIDGAEFAKKPLNDRMALLNEFLKADLVNIDMYLQTNYASASAGQADNVNIVIENMQIHAITHYILQMVAELGIEIENITNIAIEEHETLWTDTESSAFSIGTLLTRSEVHQALQSGGATQQTIVSQYAEEYSAFLEKIKSVISKFEDLASRTTDSVNQMVSEDENLSNLFGGVV